MSRKCLLDCSANGAKWADDVQKDFAMTVERDETPQHIEVRFVDN